MALGLGACTTRRAEPAPSPSPVAESRHPDAPAPTASAAPARWPPRIPPSASSDWCTRELPALDRETCYVLPKSPTHTLLIYLPGVVPPGKDSPQKTNVERVVRSAADRAGVAALLPRGKQGLAPKGLKDWWGWPTTEREYRKLSAPLVTKIHEKKRELEQATGTAFSRVYLAGSSSGAYFIALLALHGGMRADGFGILSGGAGRATPELPRLTPRPVYIGFGSEDSVGAAARRLGRVFLKAGWPVRIAVHHVGHGAKQVYLDEAFAFWKGQAKTDP